MCFFKLIAHFLTKKPKLNELKKVVFVGPHPDDIEIASGGTVAKLKELGVEIHFIITTDGCLGTDNDAISEELLAKTREIEAIESAKILGAQSISFLSFPDGGLYPQEDLNIELYKKIMEISPDLIWGPDPSLKNECHLDHIKTGKAIEFCAINSGNILLAKRYGLSTNKNLKGIAYYFTSNPNFFITTRKRHIAKQLTALKMHESQVKQKIDKYDNMKLLSLVIKISSKKNGFKRCRFNSEAFRYVHPLEWHCFTF